MIFTANSKVQVDIIGMISNVIIGCFRVIKLMIYGNDYDHKIMVLFIRLKILVETLEYQNPTKLYPVLTKKEGQTFYYKLPLGLTFKKIKDNSDAFEDAFKPNNVTIVEINDPNAHFSVEIH